MSLTVRPAIVAIVAEWLYGVFPNRSVEFIMGSGFVSPAFSTTCSTPSNKLVSVEWRLRLFPRGKLHDGYVEVQLENETSIRASAKFKVTLRSESGTVLCESGETLGVAGRPETWLALKLDSTSLVDMKLENLETFGRRKENLVVVCSVSHVSTDEEGDATVPREDDTHVCEFTAHYESLLETGQFSDVTFNVGEKSLRLHKSILTKSSAVFGAMFEHEMKEQKESVVNVVDVDFDVMKEFIRYVYARKVNDIEKIAAKLFVVADRYAVEGLGRLCERQLFDQLSVENVLDRLELSVKYGMAKLKAKALGLVVANMKDFAGKPEFKELSTECKDEVLEYISTKTISDPRS